MYWFVEGDSSGLQQGFGKAIETFEQVGVPLLVTSLQGAYLVNNWWAVWRDIHLENLRFLAGSLLPWVGECWIILAYFSEDGRYYLEMFTCRSFTLGVVGNCWCVAEAFLVADQGHLACCGWGLRVEACSCLYCVLLLQILAPLPSWETVSEFPYFHYFQGEKSPAIELSALETLRLKWTLIHSASIYCALCSGKREEDVIVTSGSL